MTTVAFVTYKSGGVDRRIGPITLEHAKPMANELARQVLVTDVVLEEWALLKATTVTRPA